MNPLTSAPQTSRFGWRSYQDGLRGHLFLSPDKKQGLVVFKGTSLSQLGANPTPDDTSRRDRFNVRAQDPQRRGLCLILILRITCCSPAVVQMLLGMSRPLILAIARWQTANAARPASLDR